jgi:hypothetical protein
MAGSAGEGAGAPVKNMLVYAAVWLVLVGSAVFETIAVIEGITASPLLFVTSMAIFQAALIALFFQYLREESFAIKGMTLSGAALVAALIIAAVTSVLTCTPYFPAS